MLPGEGLSTGWASKPPPSRVYVNTAGLSLGGYGQGCQTKDSELNLNFRSTKSNFFFFLVEECPIQLFIASVKNECDWVSVVLFAESDHLGVGNESFPPAWLPKSCLSSFYLLMAPFPCGLRQAAHWVR